MKRLIEREEWPASHRLIVVALQGPVVLPSRRAGWLTAAELGIPTGPPSPAVCWRRPCCAPRMPASSQELQAWQPSKRLAASVAGLARRVQPKPDRRRRTAGDLVAAYGVVSREGRLTATIPDGAVDALTQSSAQMALVIVGSWGGRAARSGRRLVVDSLSIAFRLCFPGTSPGEGPPEWGGSLQAAGPRWPLQPWPPRAPLCDGPGAHAPGHGGASVPGGCGTPP